MPRKQTKNVSHLTYTQAGRFVGVSQAAVSLRATRTPNLLPTVEVFGVNMVSSNDCRRWMRERRRAERARLIVETTRAS